MPIRSHCAHYRKTGSDGGRKAGPASASLADPTVETARRRGRRRRPRRRRFAPVAAGLAAAGLAVMVAVSWLLCAAFSRRAAEPRGDSQAVQAVTPVAPAARASASPPRVPPPARPPVAPPPGSVPLPPPPAPVAVPTPLPGTPPVPFKRRDTLTEDLLRKQLLEVPEVALDRVPNTSRNLFLAAGASQGKSYPGPAELLRHRAALSGLPFLLGKDCHISTERADDLGALSQALRGHLQACTVKHDSETRLDAARLRDLLAEQRQGRGQWHRPEALPALLQNLQVEEAPVRLVLVDLLGEMDDPRAQAALAVRALVDLSAEVRQAAVRMLARRPPKSYRGLLLAGFRYPWPPAAAHAAEALVALGDKKAAPMLEALFDQPPPGLPSPAIDGLPRPLAVRELVRVNHLSNCLLCHPPSFHAADRVRGVIPVPDRDPSASGGYLGDFHDLFVRADVTYLRQDFSLLQPVARHPAKWPGIQRFDYVVRVRAPTQTDWKRSREKKEHLTKEYRAAIGFALRELTGEEAVGKAEFASGGAGVRPAGRLPR